MANLTDPGLGDSGVYRTDPVQAKGTKLGEQVEESHLEIPCKYGVSSTLEGVGCSTTS